jgi:zinc-binding alcohol dehydrogenase/oxidoreductase
VTVPVRPLYLEWKSILGTTLGSRNDFSALLRLFQTAAWSPVIDSIFPLADAAKAQERLAGDHFGKIVLEVLG